MSWGRITCLRGVGVSNQAGAAHLLLSFFQHRQRGGTAHRRHARTGTRKSRRSTCPSSKWCWLASYSPRQRAPRTRAHQASLAGRLPTAAAARNFETLAPATTFSPPSPPASRYPVRPPLHRPHSQPHSPPKAVTGPQPSPSSPLGPRTRCRPPARRRPTTLSRLAASLLPGLSGLTLSGLLPGWREVTDSTDDAMHDPAGWAGSVGASACHGRCEIRSTVKNLP